VNSGLYVVMGVSGAAKSLIGETFARKLAVDFVEGHDFHLAENVARMASGVPPRYPAGSGVQCRSVG
jgi:hypothetical protein